MITSIKLKGMYSIGVNSTGHIDVNGTNVALKEIPFVRYDYERLSETELEYIKKSMDKFNHSTHLVQLHVNPFLMESAMKVKEIESSVAKYLYLEIKQENLQNNVLAEDDLALAKQSLSVLKFDRIMLIDKTNDMGMAGAKQIIANTAKYLGVKVDTIGICESPLCMSGELACLTALKARELATLYNSSNDIVTPSANHQCMNCCGCMRYFDVTTDIAAPADNKKKKSAEKTDKTTKNIEKKPKKTAIATTSWMV